MFYYTYAHIRPDTEAIFNIGKGSKRRAYSKANRNDHWRRFSDKSARESVGRFAKAYRDAHPELSINHGILIKQKWLTSEYRGKFTYRDWWSKNCLHRHYWGA